MKAHVYEPCSSEFQIKPWLFQWQNIITSTDVASYLVSLDKDKVYFTDELLGKEIVEEEITKKNFRLNKILHLANILHYSKHGKALFEEELRAFPHGAMIEEIYCKLLKNEELTPYSRGSNFLEHHGEKEEMVRKVFNRFKQYDDKQLIFFSQEDPAWEAAWKNKIKYLSISEEIIKFYQVFYNHAVKELDCFI